MNLSKEGGGLDVEQSGHSNKTADLDECVHTHVHASGHASHNPSSKKGSRALRVAVRLSSSYLKVLVLEIRSS